MASTVLPNGIIIPEKFSRDWYADLYHNWQELDNLLGGGTPKDGTLTIQKNGTTVGTFSANQATDETINIEVPTATSELTNDSGFITGVSWNDVSNKPSFATVATSGSYNDLSNKPTIPTVNNATLTIQQNGTTVDTFTANSSSDKTVNIQCVDLSSNQTVGGNKEFTGTTTAHDLVPSATETYNFGSPSYQWNNAYIKSLTINGVACGDILTHNASEFVDVTTAQTVGGQKIFTHGATGLGRDSYHFATIPYGKNTPPANTSYQYIWFGGNTASQGFANSWYSGYLEQVVNTDGSARGRWFIRDTSESGIGIELFVNGDNKQLRPLGNNITDLGTSTNKWKSFNGINPGALSLPSSSYINVDTTNWDLTCQNGLMGSFTPTADGWLMLHVVNSGTNEASFWIIGGVLRINNRSSLNTDRNDNFNMITIPVEKDKTYNIYGNALEYVAGRRISYCIFMPCRGNV